MSNKVTILMATYNGEKYIRDQIESIINQTYSNWELIIRDDKSSDKTLAIINEYKEKDHRIFILNSMNRLGAVLNFNELIKNNLEKEYIMFSDQDDIWKENKVEISLNSMTSNEKELGSDTPLLVYTDFNYVDENLIEKSMDISFDYNNEERLKRLLAFNYIWGCSIIVNKALIKKSYPLNEFVENHDYWLALNAALYGEIIHLKEKTFFYRQHSSNVTGGDKVNSLKKRLNRLNKVKIIFDKQIQQNLYFCKINSQSNNITLSQYSEIFKENRLKALIKANKLGLVKDTKLGTLLLWLYILTRSNKEGYNGFK